MNRLRRLLRSRGVRSASLLAILLIVLFSVIIAFIGLIAKDHLVWQTIGFAVTGALLQTAFLGLVYEVWLRDEVENSTLQKLDLSRRVVDHGLERISGHADIDWTLLLDGVSTICVASNRPDQAIGFSASIVIQHARSNGLRSVRIAVPASNWNDCERWILDFESTWRRARLSSSTLYFVELAAPLPYDLLAFGDRVAILLPPGQPDLAESGPKMLQFRSTRKDDAIGTWLHSQVLEIETKNSRRVCLPERVKNDSPASLSDTGSDTLDSEAESLS